MARTRIRDVRTDGRTDGRTTRRLSAPPKYFGEHYKCFGFYIRTLFNSKLQFSVNINKNPLFNNSKVILNIHVIFSTFNNRIQVIPCLILICCLATFEDEVRKRKTEEENRFFDSV